jgi:hypothetical protein
VTGKGIGSVAQTSFAQADAHRLDVEFLLEPLENLVADRAMVPKRDQGSALGRQGLVAEPAEGRLLAGGVGVGAQLDWRRALDPLGGRELAFAWRARPPR